ncbi:hypothetical protein ACFPH6_20265 [Streptomyces xiangluensis]|uniref:Pycsar effector protein domain-containing protein n=1 Tax=Streptomyces xiangluensis TaxID=2665720 RepID=A0ABV8YRQ4_9ACTN
MVTAGDGPGADDPLRPSSDPAGQNGTEADAEYVRRVYDRAIDWYRVAEAKAQLILTVNGVLVTVIFGTAAGNVTKKHEFAKISGVETWCFFLVSTGSLIGAVACAAACLWSRHVKNVKGTFARLRVYPEIPNSYRPEVLWYFGDLAHLEIEPAAALISRADRRFEIKALSYNVVHLAGIVLRKHRFVNAGWALTALAIISLIVGVASIFIRAQI